MRQVRIASLALDPRTDQPVVLLKPLDEPAGTGVMLPIWIGQPEATAILIGLENIATARPMTHDLLAGTVRALGRSVDRVDITRVEEGTFFAVIHLSGEGSTTTLDARPSDSIALAVRMGAPIFVAEEVFAEAGVEDESVIAVDEESQVAEFMDFIDHVDPADFAS